MEVELRNILILQSELLDAAIDRLGDLSDRFGVLLDRQEVIVEKCLEAARLSGQDFTRRLIENEIEKCAEKTRLDKQRMLNKGRAVTRS